MRSMRAPSGRQAASSWWRAPAITAATALSRRGCSPSAATRGRCCSSATWRGSRAMRRWRRNNGAGPVAPARPAQARHGAATWSIDALFGAGLDRPVEGPAARHDRGNERASRAGRCRRPAERDQRHVRRGHGRAVKAAQTVTFFRKKARHLLLPGRLHCGAISGRRYRHSGGRCWTQIAPQTFENRPALWRAHFPVPRARRPQIRPRACRGRIRPSWSTGAARLAARGALRAGAGLVTIASPREALASTPRPTSR